MHEQDIVNRVAERLGVSKAAAKTVVREIESIVAEAIAKGEKVHLGEAGKFKPHFDEKGSCISSMEYRVGLGVLKRIQIRERAKELMRAISSIAGFDYNDEVVRYFEESFERCHEEED